MPDALEAIRGCHAVWRRLLKRVACDHPSSGLQSHTTTRRRRSIHVAVTPWSPDVASCGRPCLVGVPKRAPIVLGSVHDSPGRFTDHSRRVEIAPVDHMATLMPWSVVTTSAMKTVLDKVCADADASLERPGVAVIMVMPAVRTHVTR